MFILENHKRLAEILLNPNLDKISDHWSLMDFQLKKYFLTCDGDDTSLQSY